MVASNSRGNPGILCNLIDSSFINDLINKQNATMTCTHKNERRKTGLGWIRLRVIAAVASAPPHHFNSQAAQKPMIARAESGED